MAYVLIEAGVVVQKQPYPQEGFVEAPDTAVCGMVANQDGTYSLPAPTPAPVPESISPRQLRQSLTHFGFRAAVESAIGAADQDTKDWYQFATEFQRHHPLVISMAASLGYTTAQLDDVWTYGAGI